LPPAVSWWPPAPGWWIIFFIILGLLALLFWYILQTRKKRKVSGQANTELEQIEYRFLSSENTEEAFRELSILTRRVVLTLSDDSRVAGLRGKNWVSFLNHIAASHLKNLEMLIVHPYLKQIEADPLLLVDDLRQWMKKLPNRQKILNLRIREWFENASNASDFKFESTMLTHD
tara:strand:- start:232 stop:753 length:522 start_codon:yes stop_codon:yes gene_type:complete